MMGPDQDHLFHNTLEDCVFHDCKTDGKIGSASNSFSYREQLLSADYKEDQGIVPTDDHTFGRWLPQPVPN